MKNSNDARIALEQTITDLLSGKATNLDAAGLAIKGFSVLVSQQRNHQKECVLNGKTSVKQNAGWAKYAKEASTADQEAKAKAKAARQGLADFNPQLKAIAEKREALSQYDGREKAIRDEKAKLDAEEQAIKAQIKELS
tara:strand:+ start:721 stop:1137 length:417 start_codon:yes stop_codon:yes gene_type:complete